MTFVLESVGNFALASEMREYNVVPITVEHVSSVPTNGVKDLSFALGFNARENVADVIVQIVRLDERLRDLEDNEGADRRLFVIILNVEIDDVDELFGVGSPRLQALDALIVDALFSREDDVETLFGVLKPFWPRLYSAVSI